MISDGIKELLTDSSLKFKAQTSCLFRYRDDEILILEEIVSAHNVLPLTGVENESLGQQKLR